MGRRQFSPTTQKFDERLVVRKQEAFNYGMVSDSDPTDIPYNAVAHLENARGHKNAIKGRTGIRRWSNIRLPIKKTVTVTKNGNKILATGSTTFTQDDVGCSAYTKGGVLLFTKFISSSEMEVAEKPVISDGPDTFSMISKVNAQYYDFVEGIRYLLVGRKLYARKGKEAAWIEYYCVNEAPSDTMSQIFKVSGKYVIVNNNGIYAFNSLFDSTFMYKMNDSIPMNRIPDKNSSITKGATVHTYRYLYTYSRMNSGSRLDGVEIQVETPPMYSTDVDYGQISLSTPILKSRYRRLALMLEGYTAHLKWVELTEKKPYSYIAITIDGVQTKCYMDFSSVESMEDVAKALELGFVDASSTFFCEYNGTSFNVFNSDPSVVWGFSSNTGDTNDMVASGVIGTSLETFPMGALVNGLKPPTIRKDITHYSIYRTADIHPYTKSPVDLLDPRIGNNPDIYAWVADIPLVTSVKGSIATIGSDKLFTASRAGISHVIGSVCKFYVDGVEVGTGKLSATDTENVYKITATTGLANTAYLDITVNCGEKYNVTKATKSGRMVETVNGTTLNSLSVGGPIYWDNGKVDIIKRFVDNYTVEVIDEGNIVGTMSAFDFNDTASYTRDFYDEVSDGTRIGYLREFQLKTRFMEPIPSTNVGCYHNAVLLLGKTDQDKIWYTDTNDFKSLGYHNSINQSNDSLNKNVQCMFVVNDLFGILTTSSTYTINPKQATVVSNEFGEFFTRLPDPYLVNNSIGAANQFRWSRGEKGDVMVVTNEPAVRFFDGVNWTANLANEKIQHTELQLMNESMVSSYSGTGGIHIWGYRSNLWT